MQVLPQQVTEFLSEAAPFDNLSVRKIEDLASHIEILYLNEDNVDELISAQSKALYLILSGAFAVEDSSHGQRNVSEGDYFNFANAMEYEDTPLQVSVEEAGLVYRLPLTAFKKVLSEPAIESFFRATIEDSIENQAVYESNSMWLYKPLQDVIHGDPVTADEMLPLRDTAEVMSQHGVSSVLILSQGKLAGIVTDRDLRNRAMAKGLDYATPVREIMTAEPAMLTQHRTLFDAMALMGERNIHHVPIVDRNTREPLGMLTATDIIRLQRSNVLFIISELSKASSLYELTELSWQLPHYFSSHARRPGDFDIAGKVLSQATDIMTRKLIAFYELDHGKAPVNWCWLVYGSQAREDQTLGSDQDNGLLLEERPTPEQQVWFKEMAEYVCNGLNKCGIRLCEGNIMASNPDLRMSLQDAIDEAKGWIEQPTPEAVLQFNIFLDARPVAGDYGLFRKLQAARAPMFSQSIFLAALARATNDMSVPLSLFHKFVYEKKADSDDAIDLKKRAIAIINNLARLYALANKITVPNTVHRLASLPSGGGISKKDADNLRDIWLFLGRLRWRHQLSNSVTDNNVQMGQLSSIEKHQLKAAFKAIDRAQQAAINRFSGGVR